MNQTRLMHLSQWISSGTLIVLIFLCLLWELRLAPLRPGGSTLFLKAVPLLLPLFGILKGRRYTYQWSSMLILAYFAEGIVRATSDPGPSRYPAMVETGLAALFFAASITYAKLSSQQIRRLPGD